LLFKNQQGDLTCHTPPVILLGLSQRESGWTGEPVEFGSQLTQRADLDEVELQGGAELLEEAATYGTEAVLAVLSGWQEDLKQSVFQWLASRSSAIYQQIEQMLIETAEGWRFIFGSYSRSNFG
jgi:hypothetical protein